MNGPILIFTDLLRSVAVLYHSSCHGLSPPRSPCSQSLPKGRQGLASQISVAQHIESDLVLRIPQYTPNPCLHVSRKGRRFPADTRWDVVRLEGDTATWCKMDRTHRLSNILAWIYAAYDRFDIGNVSRREGVFSTSWRLWALAPSGVSEWGHVEAQFTSWSLRHGAREWLVTPGAVFERFQQRTASLPLNEG